MYIATKLEAEDISCYVDEKYEIDLLGVRMSDEFQRIFTDSSRLVVALLDKLHRQKLWPSFERACFKPRIADKSVIPVFLDDTVFPEIPTDLKGIKIGTVRKSHPPSLERLYKNVVLPIVAKLGT
jgi:hypothetical protein